MDEISTRLLMKMKELYPARGKFRLLEELTQIPADRWKNFWYGKQAATGEMLAAWLKHHPDEEAWVINGKHVPKADGYPFGTGAPRASDVTTIGDRLNWVIKMWASPAGDRLFSYLSEKSDGKITPTEWSRVILGLEQPSAAMVSVVCSRNDIFTDWVLFGLTKSHEQVDPSDQMSVDRWRKKRRELLFGDFAE